MAVIGFGILLKMGDANGGGGSKTTIAEVLSLKPWGDRTNFKPSTTHTSSPARVTTMKATTRTVTPLRARILITPTETTHNATAGLRYVQRNFLTRDFDVVYPDGSTETALCNVASLEKGDIDTEGLLEADLELQPVGDMGVVV